MSDHIFESMTREDQAIELLQVGFTSGFTPSLILRIGTFLAENRAIALAVEHAETLRALDDAMAKDD